MRRGTSRGRPARALRLLSLLALTGLALGCATRYSPATVRSEIVRQRGVDPRSEFEVNLGRLTTYLLKSALTTAEGEVPFEGLRQIQLSVYGIPEQPGPALDVTQFAVRGWETLVRARDERRSIMILVRAKAEGKIGDLVIVGAGRRKVVYGRLQGALSDELPDKLRAVFEHGGPDELVDALTD